MIKLLNHLDYKKVESFLNKNKYENIYLYNYLELHGFNKFQKIYGEFKNNKLIAILILNYTGSLFYAISNFNIEGFSSLIRLYKVSNIRGQDIFIDQFKERLTHRNIARGRLAILKTKDHLIYDDNIMVEELSTNNVDLFIDFNNSIPEFSSGNENKEFIYSQVKSKFRKGYAIRVNNKIVSSCQSINETICTSNIINVATLPNYRRNNYSAICISKLCDDILSMNKYPVLSNNTESARKLYDKLGFETICNWSSLNIY